MACTMTTLIAHLATDGLDSATLLEHDPGDGHRLLGRDGLIQRDPDQMASHIGNGRLHPERRNRIATLIARNAREDETVGCEGNPGLVGEGSSGRDRSLAEAGQ